MAHADDTTVGYTEERTNEFIRIAQGQQPLEERQIYSNLAIARAIQEVGEKIDRALACYTIDVNRVNE